MEAIGLRPKGASEILPFEGRGPAMSGHRQMAACRKRDEERAIASNRRRESARRRRSPTAAFSNDMLRVRDLLLDAPATCDEQERERNECERRRFRHGAGWAELSADLTRWMQAGVHVDVDIPLIQCEDQVGKRVG